MSNDVSVSFVAGAALFFSSLGKKKSEKTSREKKSAINSNDLKLRVYLLRWSDRQSMQTVFHSDTRSYEVKGQYTNQDLSHPNTYCDNCAAIAERDKTCNTSSAFSPIAGMRYRCLECDDFDMCAQCFLARDSVTICGHDGHRYCVFDRPVLHPGEVLSASYSDCLVNMLLNSGDMPAIGTIVSSSSAEFSWMSFREVYCQAMQCGAAMRELGLQAEDFVLLCAENSLEYVIFNIACGIFGFTTVPVSPSLPAEDVTAIVNQLPRQCRLVACSAATVPLLRALLNTWTRTESGACVGQSGVLHVVTLDTSSPSVVGSLTETPRLHCHSFQNLLLRGECLQRTSHGGSPHLLSPQGVPDTALVTIAFTSGTSKGVPKGIPITGRERRSLMDTWARSYYTLRASREIGFIFTSLAYEANMETVLSLLFMGGQAGIYSQRVEGMAELTRELRLLRPTYIAAPPVFWTELYNKYCAELSVLDPRSVSELITASSLASTEAELSSVERLRASYGSMFGDRLNRVSTGSAHTPAPVLRFMKEVISSGDHACVLNEGYGAMECGGIANNGTFLWDVQWRLLPVEGYTDTAEHIYGELLVKTPLMSDKYYNNEDMSQDRYTPDGYFKTGDLVSLQCMCRDFRDYSLNSPDCDSAQLQACTCERLGGRKVRVIGRTVAMVKLSDGEHYHPEIIEGALIECPSILQVYLHVDITWNFPVGVVVVDESLLALGVAHVESVIFSEMAELVASGKVTRKSLPMGVIISCERFTTSNGLLTVSSKICRPKLRMRYLAALTEKYAELQAAVTERTILNLMAHQLTSRGDGASINSALSKDTNIWNAGLNSLSAAALASTMASSLNIPQEVSLNMVLESESVEILSQRVDKWTLAGGREDDGEREEEEGGGQGWRTQIYADLEWRPVHSSETECLPAAPAATAAASATASAPASAGTAAGAATTSAAAGSSAARGDKETVLLTGATGFLGSVLLADLLLRCLDRFRVVVIARGGPPATQASTSTSCPADDMQPLGARGRVLQQLAQHVSAEDMEVVVQSGTLQVLQGDLSQALLGLSREQYSSLVEVVDVVLHCAATTSWIASYTQLRSANVTATQHVLQLIADGKTCHKPKRLCHVSTISADISHTVPSGQETVNYDRDTRAYVGRLQHAVGQGYPVSKMVAECLVRSCCEALHVPFIIVRPGTISAHSTTGFSNVTDFTTRLIKSINRSGTCPVLDEHTSGGLDLACVDFVAAEVTSLVMAGEHTCSTVNVSNEVATSFASILATLVHHSCHDERNCASTFGCSLMLMEEHEWIQRVAEDSGDPLHLLAGSLFSVLHHKSSLISRPVALPSSSSSEVTAPHRTRPCRDCPRYDPAAMIPLTLSWLENSKR